LLAARAWHVNHGLSAVQFTFLQWDGSDRERELSPARLTHGPSRGAAVWIGAPRPDEEFVVAEGLETCLSARFGPRTAAPHRAPSSSMAHNDKKPALVESQWYGKKPAASPPALIKGVLQHTGVATIGGQSGSGKTFQAIHLAVRLIPDCNQQTYVDRYRIKRTAVSCIWCWKASPRSHAGHSGLVVISRNGIHPLLCPLLPLDLPLLLRGLSVPESMPRPPARRVPRCGDGGFCSFRRGTRTGPLLLGSMKRAQPRPERKRSREALDPQW
jgi:hypothetical protein